MSPSTYLIAIPLSVIAVSSWMVKIEGDSFSAGKRTSGPQQVPLYAMNGSADLGVLEAEPPCRLDHERYGWTNPETTAMRMESSTRPLGGRAMPVANGSPAPASKVAAAEHDDDLPDIPGFVNMPAPEQPFFETVPADSGFHIAADEATKVDMDKQIVTFNGHVKLASPQFHLTATKLVVHLGKDKKSFRLLEATGSVDVQLTGVPDDKKYRGQSGVAIYDPSKGTLTLTGWPKIQGSGQELVASDANTRVVLVPKTGRMLTEGRAQTRVAKRLMEESGPRP